MSTRKQKVTLQMKYLYKDNKVFQYFIVVDTKLKKYVLQNKYLLNSKLENYIEQNALSLVDERYTFVNRKDEDDRVSLEFAINNSENLEKKATNFFALIGEVPCSDGCEECKYRDSDVCTKKNKTIEKMLKNCKFFSQKQGGENEN